MKSWGGHHVGQPPVKCQGWAVVFVSILALTEVGYRCEQFLKRLPLQGVKWWSGFVAAGTDALEARSIPAIV